MGRVEATGDFLLLMAWLNYLDRQGIVPMAMAACLLHELGHWAVIRLLGGQISLVRLTAVGAEMVLRCPMGYWQEGVSALAGPGVNLLLALIFCAWPGGAVFAGLNLVLACFNMLPAGRLDGGRALACTLALLAGPDLSEQTGGCLDRLCVAGLLTAGVLTGVLGNPTLLLVALWLLSVQIPQNNWNRRRNRACQRGRKQVK